MRKNDEIGYGSFVEKELRRVVAIKLSVNQGRFREESVFFGGRRDTPTPTHSTFYPGSLDDFGIWHNITVGRMGAWHKLKDKTMNAKKYKVAITEIAAKTAAKKNGGAAARYWGVIVIDKETGEKRTAADIIATAARKAAADKDEKAAAVVRERAKIYGGAYRRDTAAIIAAAAYAEKNGGCELAKSIAARLDEARRVEAEYTAAEEKRKAERRARRLANMTDAEKAAAAAREEIRAIKEDAKKRIVAIKIKAMA